VIIAQSLSVGGRENILTLQTVIIAQTLSVGGRENILSFSCSSVITLLLSCCTEHLADV